MAPEVILTGMKEEKKGKGGKNDKNKRRGYGKECDIWSAGVTLYAMLFKRMPFRGSNVRETKDRVLRGTFPMLDHVSEEGRNLIQGMLTADVSRRLTI